MYLLQSQDLVELPDAPPIRGLVFRWFRGASDDTHMLDMLEAHTIGHGIVYANSIEAIGFVFTHLTNCDACWEVLMAEIDDEAIAFIRVRWEAIEDGTRLYKSLGFLKPAWQRNGVGRAMLPYNENCCAISLQENAKYKRLRGYTQDIFCAQTMVKAGARSRPSVPEYRDVHGSRHGRDDAGRRLGESKWGTGILQVGGLPHNAQAHHLPQDYAAESAILANTLMQHGMSNQCPLFR